MKKLHGFILAAVLLMLAGCAAAGAGPEAVSTAEAVEAVEAAVMPADERPGLISLSASGELPDGVSRENGVFIVEKAGTYRVTGSTQSRVQVDADGPVELILAGVRLEGPQAVCVLSKDPVTITAEAGTENVLYDGLEEPDEDAEAAVWSRAPLTIGGEGSITVLAGGNNGVRCKSILTVEGTTLTVKAANNGLKADGGIVIGGGSVSVTCSGDAMEAEPGRIGAGDITIRGGSVSVAATGAGLHAEGTVAVSGGILEICSGDDALKGTAVELTGGRIAITAGADGIQAAETLNIAGGDIVLTVGKDGLRAADITVKAGTMKAECAGDGIQAEETLYITGGDVTVTAGEDGLRGTDVSVSEGTVTVVSVGDGIQADVSVDVEGGAISVTAGGGGGNAINRSGESFGPMMRSSSSYTVSEISAKGIRSDDTITISGGRIDLDTDDDAIHAAALCTISGGEIRVVSSDDAIHSDDMLVIDDGTILISDCFEGLEGFAVEVNGGNTVIRAVNDGINASGSEFGMGWGWDRNAEEEAFSSISGAATTYYRQTGGTVDIVVTGNSNNCGDGIDSNGYVYINGGVLTVSTFGNTMEGGIDTGRGGPVVTGGMVLAGGASMMQESWASESTQCCALVTTDRQPGGTVVTIYDEDGSTVWSVTMADTFGCLILSHPDLLPGHMYTLDYGGGTVTLDFTSSSILRLGSGGGFGGFR